VRQNRDGEQKSFRPYGLFSVIVFFGATFLYAQSFEDFKHSQAVSFAKYADERDNAFNKYLKSEWKAYAEHKGIKLYEEPKPKTIAHAKPKKIKIVGPKISIKINKAKHKEPQLIHKSVVVKKTIPKLSKIQKPTEEQIEVKKTYPKKDINFDFFGSALGFDVPNGIKTARYYPQNQKGIRNFFDTVASSKYQKLIKEITNVKNEMNLNDWGTYLLVLEISKNIYGDEGDNAKLLSWFVFNKMGYAVKVGLAKKHIVLLHYSKKVIYATPNYSFGKKKFYAVANYAKGSVGKLYSYKQNYPGANKPLDLSLKSLPNFASDMRDSLLSFKEYGHKYDIDYKYNKNLIDFMATYPQADYDVFFNAPMDEQSYVSVASGLKKYLDGKKASEAMNFVLHFVQKSFDYERDDQQFGREKVMFAQETLYYKKSDCEDRAVLYAYLVKELFGVGVVGVKYKDHMATALYIPMSGDTVKDGSRRFVVADPTYINASVGQSMPKYRSQRPQSFIVVHNN